jgi:hypothetical protein
VCGERTDSIGYTAPQMQPFGNAVAIITRNKAARGVVDWSQIRMAATYKCGKGGSPAGNRQQLGIAWIDLFHLFLQAENRSDSRIGCSWTEMHLDRICGFGVIFRCTPMVVVFLYHAIIAILATFPKGLRSDEGIASMAVSPSDGCGVFFPRSLHRV